MNLTLIVGATWRKRCWLGGDGAMVGGGVRTPIASPKVWAAAGGGVVVGIAGNLGGLIPLRSVEWRASATWVLRDAPGEITAAFMAAGVEPDTASALIGTCGRLFYYEARETYEAADKYAALGCADMFGLGWLAGTQTGWDPAERLRQCLLLASRHCMKVGGRPTIVCTDRA